MIINPEGAFKKYWGLVLIVILLYTATIMPYKIALISKDTTAWFYVDLMVDCLFLTDIYINLNSPIHIKDQIYDYNRCTIFCQYLKGWLLIDIIASLPLGIIEKIFIPSDDGIANAQILKVARLPRLYRLMRMARLVKILKMFKRSLLFQKI